LPDLLRRGAVHVIVVALIVAALAPQALAAAPRDHVTQQLLDAVDASPASLVAARGSTSQRTLAAFAPASDHTPLGAEQFHPNGVAVPPNVAMSPTLVSTAAQVVSQPGGGRTISGKASWYCCTRGWDDAAVVALPIALGGHWTTPPAIFSVVVCAERCATLPVGDACACHWGEAGQKVVDLSPAAWAAITDKDRWVYGVVNVTVYLD